LRHDEYFSNQDFAVIKLQAPIENVTPIDFIDPSQLSGKDSVLVAGFGRDENDNWGTLKYYEGTASKETFFGWFPSVHVKS
jgi:hypothetical protein